MTNQFHISDPEPANDAKYKMIPLSNIKGRIRGTSKMSKSEVREHLKDFYIVCIGDTPCQTPIDRELIMFRKSQQKIGTANFNIVCKLTLDSHSDDIKKAVEHFYKRLSKRKY